MWGARDVQGTLHLYATGNNNFSNGVRVWRFTETYPGSKVGSWGSKYGTVFSDPPGYGSPCAGSGYDIWGSGPNDIYVVGGLWGRGAVYHFDGTSWQRVTEFGEIPVAVDVSGTGPNDVWVSLADGRLLHYEGMIGATVEINPDTLNLRSKGNWITGYIELPSGYDVSNIDVSTIKLNNTVSAESKPAEIGDYDNDGISDLMVKFDRSAVEKVVPVGDKVTITISGQLSDGKKFEGTDTIKVISPSTLVDNESDIESTKPENFPEPSAVQFYQMAPGQRVNALGQNYPNPFNPATTIEYSIAQDCQVTIKLYNVAGQEVATLVDEWQTAGPHKVVFNEGDQLSRGIYYYQMKAGSFVDTKKMVVLK